MVIQQLRLVVFLLFVNLLLAGGMLYAQESPDSRGTTRPGQIIGRIQRKLETLDNDFISKLRRSDAKEARRVIGDIQGLLDDLAGAFTYAAPPPMPEQDFNALLGTIKRQPFESDQIKTLLLAARYGWFSCSQVVKVLDAFTFSSGKFSALEALWPRVVDRANGYRIIDAFTFSTDKDKAAGILAR